MFFGNTNSMLVASIWRRMWCVDLVFFCSIFRHKNVTFVSPSSVNPYQKEQCNKSRISTALSRQQTEKKKMHDWFFFSNVVVRVTLKKISVNQWFLNFEDILHLVFFCYTNENAIVLVLTNMLGELVPFTGPFTMKYELNEMLLCSCKHTIYQFTGRK